MYKIMLANEEKQVIDSLESIMEKLEKVEPIIENGLIYSILFQEYIPEDMEYYKKFLGISQNFGYMLVLVWGDRQEGSHMSNALGSSIKMQQYYIGIRECIKEHFHSVIGSVMANKIAVLIPYAKEQMEYQERLAVIENVRCLIRKMKKQADSSFRIGIGGIREFENMQESYQEALEALSYSVETVFHIADLSLGCEYEEDYPVHIEKRLFEKIEQGKVSEAKAAAEEFFDWMAERYPGSIMDIRLKVLEFILWAEHIVYEKGGMTYRFKSREDYLPTLLEFTDLVALQNWFIEKIAIACSHIANKRKEKSNNVIETAKDYIGKNYRKDLSLEEISRRANVSPYYFSKIFKEGTGKNFVEYLTGVRMEKAKELLLDNQYSMKEICTMVGYSEPNYFSRTFKKNVGVTPTEYSKKFLENIM